MKEVFKIIAVLTGICICCAFALAYVYGVAKDKIADNTQKAIEDAIKDLAPQARETREVDRDLYALFDDEGVTTGYAFVAEGQGYAGTIKILAVIDAGLANLLGIEIIESVETPGLGANIKEEPFREQFKGVAVTKGIEYTKKSIGADNQIQTITSATISSRSVVNILNEYISALRVKLGDGEDTVPRGDEVLN